MGLTKAQENALKISGRDVLVSAAAGSGKTYTLRLRIIKNILEKNADISKMLIVTFTRSAAGELKSLISSDIMNALAKNPDNPHLQRQMLLMGQADICTIDAFLSRPVRENFEKLNLPMSMRHADDAEIAALYQSIMEDVIESLYQKYGICADNGLADVELSTPLTDLFILLTTTKDSSNTIPTLIELYKKLITSSRGVETLADFINRLNADAEKDFLETREGQIVVEQLSKIIEGGIKFYDSVHELVSTNPLFVDTYRITFDEDKNELISVSESIKKGYEELRKKANEYPSRNIAGLGKGKKTPESEQLRHARDNIKQKIRSIYDSCLKYDQSEISATYKKTAEIIEVIYTILSEFDHEFIKKKKALGIYEFSDMPRYMLELLQNPDGTPSEAAKLLAGSYDEIYIDEYQDVNGIQDNIFSLLSRNNRFMVGDIKQSIYCFRDAEPQFFADYREKFTPYDPENDNSKIIVGSTIFMSNNFRSDQNVIDFSNTVCVPAFKACGSSLGYKDEDDLVYTKERPDGYVSHKVNVHIFGKGDPYAMKDQIIWANVAEPSPDASPREDGISEEAVFIANEIAHLIRTGTKVVKNENEEFEVQKLLPKDIAILLRKKTYMPGITAALRKMNINYIQSSKSDILHTSTMTRVVELMNIIDNPRNDVPLCGVLCSEYLPLEVRFTMGELVSIRSHSRDKMPLYDSIIKYGKDGENDPLDTMLSQKCRAIVEKLSDLRALSIKFSADKLLRSLAKDEYFSELGETEEFRFVYNSACSYVRNSWVGLAGFIRYFENLVKNGSISGEAPRIDDCVNIVTMHSSKGLQYNTCFLYDSGRDFNKDDLEEPLIYDKDLGVGMQILSREADKAYAEKLDNVIRSVVKLDVERKLIEEEMRILYVALTRAEERLYVTGTITGNRKFDTFLKTSKLYGISDAYTVSQSSMLGWILGAMCIEGHDKSTYNVTLHSTSDSIPFTEPLKNSDDVEDEPDDEKNQKKNDYVSIFANPPSLSPEEARISSIPSKVAASKVSDTMLDKGVFSNISDNAMKPEDEEDIKDDKKVDSKELIINRIMNIRRHKTTFDMLTSDNQSNYSAAERGTAMHAFLQFCDYASVKENGVQHEIDRLRDLDFISRSTADMLDIQQLEAFFNSKFFDVLSKAKEVRREFKFGMFRDASDFTQDKELSALVSDRKIFVQGSIDLLIENPDGSIYLCDYKTDKISESERDNPEKLQERMTETHKHQLDQYAYAIEKIFGKKPEKSYILSLALGDAVEIK